MDISALNIDSDQLREILASFDDDNLFAMSNEEVKEKMIELGAYLSEALCLNNPPTITFFNEEDSNTHGLYSPSTNTVQINEDHLLLDPVGLMAHEIWHAYQREIAENPQTELDYLYIYEFENYIDADDDYDGYYNQTVEREARAFGVAINKMMIRED